MLATNNSCISLSSITIPDSVTEMDEIALDACYSLKTIHIDDSKKLEYIRIPKEVDNTPF